MRNTNKMLLWFLVMFVVFCGSVLNAQSSATVGYSIVPESNGRVRLIVKNQYSKPVTALLAVGKRQMINGSGADSSLRFFDCVINNHYQEVAPGAAYTFTFFGPRPAPDQVHAEVQLKAALFADGSAWGDPQWVAKLQHRREVNLAYLHAALALLNAGQQEGADRTAIVKEIRSEESAKLAAVHDFDEQRLIRVIYEDLAGNLNIPTRGDGSAIPLSEKISEQKAFLVTRIHLAESAKATVSR